MSISVSDPPCLLPSHLPYTLTRPSSCSLPSDIPFITSFSPGCLFPSRASIPFHPFHTSQWVQLIFCSPIHFSLFLFSPTILVSFNFLTRPFPVPPFVLLQVPRLLFPPFSCLSISRHFLVNQLFRLPSFIFLAVLPFS